jgi:uncharacterized membrane-anchored protein
MVWKVLRASVAALLLSVAAAAWSQSAAHSEVERASQAALAAKIAGPTAVALGNQATLALPDGFAFIPRKEAAILMQAMGNHTDDGFQGLVVGEHLSGFVSVRFDPSGYIKDDDAKDWNSDELLQNLKDGTEAGNEERRKRGIPEFVVSGWVEKPAYDPATHRLVWSAELRDKQSQPGNPGPGVNYNTYQLGREGYMSMNLVTDLAAVEAEKPLARQLLAGLSFNAGKAYADYDASTDKVAAYGLAALVGGVAAKKLGLLAVVGAFLAKFAKVGLLAAAGGVVVVRKFLRRKKEV